MDAAKYKISVLGDMGVGKTCLALRFVSDTFRTDHKATISDIETKTVRIHGNEIIFQIWDTAGQERFRSLLPLYMKGIDGALVVYDITDKETFEHVGMWISEVRKYSSEDTVIMIVGNKLDLVQSDKMSRCVSKQDTKDLSAVHNLVFMEASAKSGENVQRAFMCLGEEIMKNKKAANNTHAYERVNVENNDGTNNKSKCC